MRKSNTAREAYRLLLQLNCNREITPEQSTWLTASMAALGGLIQRLELSETIDITQGAEK